MRRLSTHQGVRTQGFTLLEILIALAIFAILSMMAYAGLASILKARAATEPRSEQLAQLQTTLYLLNEDLSQASNRPIRDELGTAEPAFTGGRGSDILTLTRSVPLWSNESAANTLQRISYRFEEGALYRQVWAFTDRTPQSTFRRRKLINADHVTVRYFDQAQQRWKALSGSETGIGIPNAVEVNFILSGLGSIQRLFLIHQ
jgi:general secretion pathway protein J